MGVIRVDLAHPAGPSKDAGSLGAEHRGQLVEPDRQLAVGVTEPCSGACVCGQCNPSAPEWTPRRRPLNRSHAPGLEHTLRPQRTRLLDEGATAAQPVTRGNRTPGA